MNVFFPIIELIDRYAIAVVKFQRTNGANQEELDYYKIQVSELPLALIDDEIRLLRDIHEKIWHLESELKSGKESCLPLEEIGRRAIIIRDWNNKRIAVKNSIADRLERDRVREIKKIIFHSD
jgi:hypothetical protein